MYQLLLEFYTWNGDYVLQSIPIFETLKECQWWSDYLTDQYETFHDADVITRSCNFMED